jgi:hypothetical protein
MWPYGGSLFNLVASIQGRLSRYPDVAEKVVVFNKHQDVSAKDQKRMQMAGEVIIDYQISLLFPVFYQKEMQY